MKAKTRWVYITLLIGLIAVLIPARPALSFSSDPASRIFTVVGGDYVSPLITSPRGMQALNSQLGSYASFAGYDQLQAVMNRESTTYLVNSTRFCGDILSILNAEFLLDGRSRIEGRRAFINEALWKRVFNSEPDVIGQRITLAGESYEIAGVVRANFRILSETEVWVPLGTRGPYATMTSLRTIGKFVAGQDWRAGEKRLGNLVHTAIVREQMIELDTIRLLPIDGEVVSFARAPNGRGCAG